MAIGTPTLTGYRDVRLTLRARRKIVFDYIKPYLAPIITGCAGLLGVFIGAILTSRRDSKRKIKDEENRRIKKIYFPIYTEIYHYFATENNFRKHHDVIHKISINEIKQKLQIILEDNYDILDNFLFRILDKIKSEKYYDDLSGGERNRNYLAVFCSFMKEFLRLQKKHKILDKNFNKEVSNIYYAYFLWFILYRKIRDWDRVGEILWLKDLMKLSYRRMCKGLFIQIWFYNYKLHGEYAAELFEKYSRMEVAFPVIMLLKNRNGKT